MTPDSREGAKMELLPCKNCQTPINCNTCWRCGIWQDKEYKKVKVKRPIEQAVFVPASVIEQVAAALKSAKQIASNECWPMEELEIENALSAMQPFLGETK